MNVTADSLTFRNNIFLQIRYTGVEKPLEEYDSVLDYLKKKFQESLTSLSYETWIEEIHVVKLTDQSIIIEVPTPLHKEYWNSHLKTKTVEYIYEYSGKEVSPIFVTEEEQAQHVTQEEEESSTRELKPIHLKSSDLNDNYTFDNFVIGKGNQMAHAAALVVAEEPGTIYNPLFFYGGVGLGKTHLMHAIGHQYLEINPNARVKYVTSENFVNDFINSIQNQTQDAFRKEYRNVDLLLVDDIQFFAEKERTQEEFFHTFNELHDDRKQIVLTSDRLPNEIPKLQERLVSRFAWGLSVDITPPDLETRIAILRKKANAERLEIPNDTLSYIAGQIDSNIRELEGALVRVQAYSAIQQSDITTSLAADALKSMIKVDKKQNVSVATIQQVVSKYYQVSIPDLKGKKRVRSIVMPRQIAMYLSRELTDTSFPDIGKAFGGKDHTTVLHAYDKIAKKKEAEPELKKEIEELKKRL